MMDETKWYIKTIYFTKSIRKGIIEFMTQQFSTQTVNDSMQERPSSEIKEPVTKRTYRTAAYKIRILDEIDQGANVNGHLASVLRREGLYRAHIKQWRDQRDRGALTPEDSNNSGSVSAETIHKELEIKYRHLEKAHKRALLLIEIQKKVYQMLKMIN
jgi:hypothetical protein